MSCHGVIFMQHWSKLDNVGEPCPVGRWGHAAVCLNYGEDQPQIFIFGGRDGDYDVLSDGWILDVQSGRWRKVSSLLTCCTVLCDTFHTLVRISFQIAKPQYIDHSLQWNNPSAKDTLMCTKICIFNP